MMEEVKKEREKFFVKKFFRNFFHSTQKLIKNQSSIERLLELLELKISKKKELKVCFNQRNIFTHFTCTFDRFSLQTKKFLFGVFLPRGSGRRVGCGKRNFFRIFVVRLSYVCVCVFVRIKPALIKL